MPGIAHETPVELLRRSPMLAAALLEGTAVEVPPGVSAVMAAGDLSSALPAELRADAVIVLDGRGSGLSRRAERLAVVVEVQMAPDEGKRRVWPAYLTLARAQHDCPVVLVVICPTQSTGRWARRPIPTGHPGFDLVPVVIDADRTPPLSGPGWVDIRPELAVLAAFTGAVDLERDAGRRWVLGAVAAADLDADRLETYTSLIRACAPTAARAALEALMTTVFKDEFVERYKAEGRAEALAELKDDFVERYKEEGRAEGRAEALAALDRVKAEGGADMLLRVLAARGFDVPGHVRERVLSCTDLGQLESWGDKAVTAASLDDVFSG
jgi:hypothetical protein